MDSRKSFNTKCFAMLWLALAGSWSLAEEAPSKDDLVQAITQAFGAKDYALAEQKCQALVNLSPEDANAHYNLACALARQGKKEAALAALAKSVEKGFSDASHMKADEDLASLHEEKAFQELAGKARKGSPERGAEIPGVRTVEGDPDGGLPYRLRLSPEGSGKKDRLIVWLHPSGGSMNRVVEQASPSFLKHGFALLVITQKNWAGWSSDDLPLLERTLAEVGKVEGLDANKPLLLGFSAGGQMALTMWQEHPERYGGLVLDAAYPIDSASYMQGKPTELTLPKTDAYKQVPILALVGDQDGGTRTWTAVQDKWLAAGVPLTYHTVPNLGHTWLFHEAETKLLGEWLDQVAAGKLPKDEIKLPVPEAPKDAKPDPNGASTKKEIPPQP